MSTAAAAKEIVTAQNKLLNCIKQCVAELHCERGNEGALKVAKPVVFVLGPTGAGKSRLASDVAHHFSGEIVNADAMQMYKGLDVVTNKVSADERARNVYHLIDCVEPLKPLVIGQFRDKAIQLIDSMLSRDVMPVICGGTNYYVESLIWHNLIPSSSTHGSDDDGDYLNFEKLRQRMSDIEVYNELKQLDLPRAEQLHPNDRRRVIRALQVFRQTGRRQSEWLAEQHASESGDCRLGGRLRVFPTCADKSCDGGSEVNQDSILARSPVIVFVVTTAVQSVLEERCDKRVDQMLESGLVEELEHFHLTCNAKREDPSNYSSGIFQAIGFKEFDQYLRLKFCDLNNGAPEVSASSQSTVEVNQKVLDKSFEDAVTQMKTATRQYARRQRKWILKRLCHESRASPPLFAFDSSDTSRFYDACSHPAIRIIQYVEDALHHCSSASSCESLQTTAERCQRHLWPSDVTERLFPLAIALQSESPVTAGRYSVADMKRVFTCDVCEERVFVGRLQFDNHLQGRKHHRQLSCRRHQELCRLSATLDTYSLAQKCLPNLKGEDNIRINIRP